MPLLELPSTNVTLAILTEDEAQLALDYYSANREHLEPWEPKREETFYTIESTRARLRASSAAFSAGTTYNFVVLDNQSGKMIGVCNFSNVVRGIFQACHLGYSIGAEYQGKGLMFEALETAIKYMFEVVGLHRIMANHMTNNVRSARLLQRLGFEIEGFAKSYLKINGVWQNHILNSKVNPRDLN